MAWEYKSSRLNFSVDNGDDGTLATEDTEQFDGTTTNVKIDGIASEATVAQAKILAGAFYGEITPFNHYNALTKTLVVTEE